MAVNNTAEASSVGMPQLDFSTFPNQAFWLFVTMLCLFIMVRLLIIPRMDNILANRRKVLEEDLVGAERFRDSAQELRNSITLEVDAARDRSNEIIAKSKLKAKINQKKGMAEALEMTTRLLLDSNKVISKMQKEANQKVDKISAEIAPVIVKKMSV
jgi:F-type H+-transporting ATPase subunit b